MREKKLPINPMQIQNNNITNNNNNNIKRTPGKDNKQFTFKQNFMNIGKLPNNNGIINNSNMGSQNYFAANWTPPASTNNIWSNSSYSEVVAQPIVEQKQNLNFPAALNGNMGYRHQEIDFGRSNSFNRVHDSCVLDQEDNNCTQYGPIGTRKSPSSTPSWEWEPLNSGINQHLSKPLAFNGTNYFQPQQNYGIQQSKLMNLMSYNDKIQQQQQQQQQHHHQQQQQQQMMNERYQYIMEMKERKQTEWLNTVGNSPAAASTSSLWSSSTNWASPSPPLSVPPGFEQQFHQPQQPQQVMQNSQPIHNSNGNSSNGNITSNNPQSSIPTYDLFKSLSVIWEPNRSDGNDRETRNQ